MVKKGWGRIVNFTGMNAMHGYAGRAPVSVAKHGVWGLTKALGVQVCASADFNDVCAQPMKSLGTHRLRGVPKPVEIFTLPD